MWRWHPCCKYILMKVAIAHWGERISPVFDVTDSLYVVEIEGNREILRESRALISRHPFQRAREVSGLGVDVLVCGALSHVLETALMRAGIQVAGFICGDVEGVVDSFMDKRLTDDRFMMPGCCGNRRRLRIQGRRGGHRWGR